MNQLNMFDILTDIKRKSISEELMKKVKDNFKNATSLECEIKEIWFYSTWKCWVILKGYYEELPEEYNLRYSDGWGFSLYDHGYEFHMELEVA